MSPRHQDPSTERPVTDTELAVLRHLWRQGDATVREIAEDLYPEGGASAQATVQKLLERLAAKGCVERRRQGRAFLFSARVSRDDLAERRLWDIADTFYDGALTPLLSHLVEGGRLDADDVGQLRRWVARQGRSASEDEGDAS